MKLATFLLVFILLVVFGCASETLDGRMTRLFEPSNPHVEALEFWHQLQQVVRSEGRIASLWPHLDAEYKKQSVELSVGQVNIVKALIEQGRLESANTWAQLSFDCDVAEFLQHEGEDEWFAIRDFENSADEDALSVLQHAQAEHLDVCYGNFVAAVVTVTSEADGVWQVGLRKAGDGWRLLHLAPREDWYDSWYSTWKLYSTLGQGGIVP